MVPDSIEPLICRLWLAVEEPCRLPDSVLAPGFVAVGGSSGSVADDAWLCLRSIATYMGLLFCKTLVLLIIRVAA